MDSALIIKAARGVSRAAADSASQTKTPLPGGSHRCRLELLLFTVLLLIVNAPLADGEWRRHFIFLPDRVVAGEWWRVFTHPLVHVSWYHLLLDGAAFLMLYAELRHWSTRGRLMAVSASAAGSLASALLSPNVFSIGFCGLSGVAHGLMAVSALEMIRGLDRWDRRVGWCALLAVVLKAGWEAARGHAALSFLHFGMMGVPITTCHAGGVVGGLIGYCLIHAIASMSGLHSRRAEYSARRNKQPRSVVGRD